MVLDKPINYPSLFDLGCAVESPRSHSLHMEPRVDKHNLLHRWLLGLGNIIPMVKQVVVCIEVGGCVVVEVDDDSSNGDGTGGGGDECTGGVVHLARRSPTEGGDSEIGGDGDGVNIVNRNHPSVSSSSYSSGSSSGSNLVTYLGDSAVGESTGGNGYSSARNSCSSSNGIYSGYIGYGTIVSFMYMYEIHRITQSRPEEQAVSMDPLGGFDLKGYSDSDYAGCNMDRKSTSGACQILGKLVCWSAKKQQSVAMSSAKAEYVAAAGCCASILWMKSQLSDYDIHYKMVPIFYDNTNAIAISNNPVLHSRTKHIDIKYHFIRDHILKRDIELHFILTKYQLVDICTKPLYEPTFIKLKAELGMLNID
ncbi:hypothetical protein Tco_0245402 [Tanacetum coccineum]